MNGWETDVPDVQNGFEYRLNSHRRILNGCYERLNDTGKIANG